MLPIGAKQLDPADWNAMLWLEDFRRIEAPGEKPYSQDKAIEHTLRLLALTPAGEAPAPVAPQPTESVDDLITRGKALRGQGKHAEALALVERAAELDPNSNSAWFNVGITRYHLGRYEQALTAYDRAISLNRNDTSAWNGKGYVLWRLDRYNEALTASEQALALDPKFTDSWDGKGSALHGLQRYNEALAAYEQATTLDPKDANAWKNMAITLRLLGRVKEAEARAKALGG
jgi:tetratricopeptide (TPR) repeat protein